MTWFVCPSPSSVSNKLTPLISNSQQASPFACRQLFMKVRDISGCLSRIGSARLGLSRDPVPPGQIRQRQIVSCLRSRLRWSKEWSHHFAALSALVADPDVSRALAYGVGD